jgi:hypothetical protein
LATVLNPTLISVCGTIDGLAEFQSVAKGNASIKRVKLLGKDEHKTPPAHGALMIDANETFQPFLLDFFNNHIGNAKAKGSFIFVDPESKEVVATKENDVIYRYFTRQLVTPCLLSIALEQMLRSNSVELIKEFGLDSQILTHLKKIAELNDLSQAKLAAALIGK